MTDLTTELERLSAGSAADRLQMLTMMGQNITTIIAALKAAELPADVAGLVAEGEALLSEAVLTPFYSNCNCDGFSIGHESGCNRKIEDRQLVLRPGDLTKVSLLLPKLTDTITALVAQLAEREAEIARLREGLHQVVFISTNHGGWFENDAWGWGQMMGDEARRALENGHG